jgi:hypothetical protein
MFIAGWIKNRKAFTAPGGGRESAGDYDIKRLKEQFEAQLKKGGKPQRPPPTGKTARLAELFDIAQTELERMRQEQIVKHLAKTPPIDLSTPANADTLRAKVRAQFKASAGLHRLDQFAGGEGTDIAGLGGLREDVSIGAAWAQASKNYESRASTIQKFIEDKVDKSVWASETMKVKLESKDK